MKKIILIAGTALAFYACTNNTYTAKEKENIAVVEKYIHAIEAKDGKTMTDLLADDYIGYGPSFTDSINKKDAVQNWEYLSKNLYAKIEYKRTVNLAKTLNDGPHPGEYVSEWSSLKITYLDGRGPVNINVNSVYRIKDGKINLSRTFYNEADVLRQLGYGFNPPKSK